MSGQSCSFGRSTALAVAALLTTVCAAKSEFNGQGFNDDHISLLQTRSRYSAHSGGNVGAALSTADAKLADFMAFEECRQGSTALGNFTTMDARSASPQHAEITEYLSMFRPCATCQHEVRVGSAADGGYLMCGELLLDITGAYSYGIKGEDEWGADISTQLGVIVHQADCYNTQLPPCPVGSTCNFDFKPVCIGEHFDKLNGRNFKTLREHIQANGHDENGSGNGRKFKTLREHIQANGHDENGSGNLVMKMDIEGSEWSVFADEDNKPLLKRFSQIIVEFHWVGGNCKLKNHQEMQLRAMRNLMQDFVVVHLHQNNCCKKYEIDGYDIGNFVELTLVRRDLIEVGSCDPSPPQSNFKNVPDREDLLPAHLPGGTQP